jgi:MSHA biogenesis protein MshJ
MKQYWERLATRIDAMTLRERVIVFAMVALILVTLVNTLVLDPLHAKRQQLSQRIKTDQLQVAALQSEIQQKVRAQSVDPDSATKARLEQAKQKLLQLQGDLQGMQKGLVSPDKMSSLLQDILRQNNRLRLLSAKTLSASSVGESIKNEKIQAMELAVPLAMAGGKDEDQRKAQGSSEKTVADSIYRHGVEIVLQGAYLDLLDYVAQLETMPWQLYWGSAKLDATDFSKVTLTLTLYTLSLDKQWLNI